MTSFCLHTLQYQAEKPSHPHLLRTKGDSGVGGRERGLGKGETEESGTMIQASVEASRTLPVCLPTYVRARHLIIRNTCDRFICIRERWTLQQCLDLIFHTVDFS